MHICVSTLTIIGTDNGLSPGRRQAIIWTNSGILLIGPLGTNFSDILKQIHTFSLKKMHLKMSFGKWRPFFLGLNVLRHQGYHLPLHVGHVTSFLWRLSMTWPEYEYARRSSDGKYFNTLRPKYQWLLRQITIQLISFSYRKIFAFC